MPRRRSGLPTGLAFEADRRRPTASSSPPTMRISVVLPQPEGPRKTTNSFRWIDEAERRRDDLDGAEALGHAVEGEMGSTSLDASQIAEGAPVQKAQKLVGDEADDADRDDAGHDLGRLHIAARRPDDEAEAANRRRRSRR